MTILAVRPKFEEVVFRCTNDLLFKALFTYKPESGPILAASLIRAILHQEFVSVSLSPTDLIQEGMFSKDIRLDLCACLEPEHFVNIEMQVAQGMDIRNRSVYYMSSLLVHQENKGRDYNHLVPVSQIFLLDFNFSESERTVHEYGMKEEGKNGELLTGIAKIVIIELENITQKSFNYDRMTMLEKWC